MAEPTEFAKLYRGRLVIIKADGTRLDVSLVKLSRLTLIAGDDGVLRYKHLVAERAVMKGCKLLVEEFQNQPTGVVLELHFFRRDDEPAGVVDIDPASIVSAAAGDADVIHVGCDCIDAMTDDIVWEEIVFAPREAKMRTEPEPAH